MQVSRMSFTMEVYTRNMPEQQDNTHHPRFKAGRHRFTSSEKDQALKLYLQL